MPTATQRFPDEKRSRRPGWTEGEGFLLANGQRWHLPAIGDNLIPLLPTLIPPADPLNEDFVANIYRDEPKAPDLDERLVEFFALALGCQYDVADGDLRRLFAGVTDKQGAAVIGAIDRFLHYLVEFATVRCPYVAGMGATVGDLN